MVGHSSEGAAIPPVRSAHKDRIALDRPSAETLPLPFKNRRPVRHLVYGAIVSAVRSGRLHEPFTQSQFRKACPGFKEGTYRAFLHQHRARNPGLQSELFQWVSPGKFKCLRPFRYGL